MKKLSLFAAILSATFSLNASANTANIWTGGVSAGASAHHISVFDSGSTPDGLAVVTLQGFTHERCSGLSNRIILKSSNHVHFQTLISTALSAFHAQSKVSLFIDVNCVAERIILLK
jgi:hypothetical protein